MGNVTFEHHLLKEAGTSPNNGALPLIVYRGAIDVGGDEPEAAVERHFGANGWGDGFRGDTFPFHHYHSIAHEVVGCARGGARLQFGGPDGPVVDVQAGDAVLIPGRRGARAPRRRAGLRQRRRLPAGATAGPLRGIGPRRSGLRRPRRYRGPSAESGWREGATRHQGRHRRGPAA